jgi:HlyD family secretion protein
VPAGPEKRRSSIWTLRNGKPVEIEVGTGLTDGTHTEITGEGLIEGLDIIVSAKPVMKP